MNAEIDELLSRYEASRRSGRPTSAEELCRDRPELLDAVRWHVHALSAVDFPTGGTDETSDVEMAARAATRAEYRVLAFHARGGLGEIARAWDESLGREVALKRIRPPLDADPERRQFFLREAAITGRLEHPGVVPVYGLGDDADGRPCYVMRFAGGRTLRDACVEFHAAGGAERFRSLAFRQLLGRFVSVCQTAAYAHSRGVVHRDIKPANVVLGEFGETLLVDWGLAQDATRPDAQPVGGTPAYMSPEQARGDAVGTPTDIFALGATLRTILTGDATGVGVPTGTSPALLAVARRATADAPDERYESALELAAEVERWLADEPVLTHRDSLLTRARRWARRRRVWVGSAAAAVVVATFAVLALGPALLRLAAERETQRQRADDNARQARRAVQDYFVAVSDGPLKSLPGSQTVRRELLQTAQRYYREFAERHGDDPALRREVIDANANVATILAETGFLDQALASSEKAVTAERGQSPGESLRLARLLRQHGRYVFQTGRRADAAAVAREALALSEASRATDPTRADRLTLLLAGDMSVVESSRNDQAAAIRWDRRGIELADTLLAADPTDHELRLLAARRRTNLSHHLILQGRFSPAIGPAVKACAILNESVPAGGAETVSQVSPAVPSADRSQLSYANTVLGIGRYCLFDLPGAIADFGRARDTLEQLAVENPTVLTYREDLGGLYGHLADVRLLLGNVADALRDARRGQAHCDAVRRADPARPEVVLRYVVCLSAAGRALSMLGRPDESEVEFTRAEAALREVARASADFLPARMTEAQLRYYWALAHRAAGRMDVAIRELHAWQTLCSEDPCERYVLAWRLVEFTDIDAGAADAAMAALRAAVRGGFAEVGLLRHDPRLDRLRSRPGFADLVRAAERHSAE